MSYDSASKPRPEELHQLLLDLYELLEGYAPAWYSVQLHEQLRATLKTLGMIELEENEFGAKPERLAEATDMGLKKKIKNEQTTDMSAEDHAALAIVWKNLEPVFELGLRTLPRETGLEMRRSITSGELIPEWTLSPVRARCTLSKHGAIVWRFSLMSQQRKR
jgi:hypothetical protein